VLKHLKYLEAYRGPDRKELGKRDSFGMWTGCGLFAPTWGGWTWQIRDGRTYRTDEEGHGLWLWLEQAGEYKQVMGTCQFSLPRDRKATLRRLNADARKEKHVSHL